MRLIVESNETPFVQPLPKNGSSSALTGLRAAKNAALDWDEEEDDLLELLLPLIRRVALLGARKAWQALMNMGVYVDWALINQAAVRWAQTYTYNLVKEITETTRAFLQEVIPDWLRGGEPLDALKEVLEPMFGEVRAEMVAVTETTRAFHEGNVTTWKESGVVDGERWTTAEDELVCEICGPLAGTVAGLGQEFIHPETGAGYTPPAHVNCRCGTVPVVEI